MNPTNPDRLTSLRADLQQPETQEQGARPERRVRGAIREVLGRIGEQLDRVGDLVDRVAPGLPAAGAAAGAAVASNVIAQVIPVPVDQIGGVVRDVLGRNSPVGEVLHGVLGRSSPVGEVVRSALGRSSPVLRVQSPVVLSTSPDGRAVVRVRSPVAFERKSPISGEGRASPFVEERELARSLLGGRSSPVAFERRSPISGEGRVSPVREGGGASRLRLGGRSSPVHLSPEVRRSSPPPPPHLEQAHSQIVGGQTLAEPPRLCRPVVERRVDQGPSAVIPVLSMPSGVIEGEAIRGEPPLLRRDRVFSPDPGGRGVRLQLQPNLPSLNPRQGPLAETVISTVELPTPVRSGASRSPLPRSSSTATPHQQLPARGALQREESKVSKSQSTVQSQQAGFFQHTRTVVVPTAVRKVREDLLVPVQNERAGVLGVFVPRKRIQQRTDLMLKKQDNLKRNLSDSRVGIQKVLNSVKGFFLAVWRTIWKKIRLA